MPKGIKMVRGQQNRIRRTPNQRAKSNLRRTKSLAPDERFATQEIL